VERRYWLVLFIIFAVFVSLRLVITHFLPPIVYTAVVFLVPIAYFIVKKDYFLFYFNISDTLPSVGINLSFAVGFVAVLLFIGFLIGNYSWVLLINKTFTDFLLSGISSFLTELLFRYFIQGVMVKLTGSTIKSVIATSILSGIVLIPSVIESISFLIMGLVIGYIFEKTKDIYGATLANWIISSFIRVIA